MLFSVNAGAKVRKKEIYIRLCKHVFRTVAAEQNTEWFRILAKFLSLWCFRSCSDLEEGGQQTVSAYSHEKCIQTASENKFTRFYEDDVMYV
jgi:hypothetical protein